MTLPIPVRLALRELRGGLAGFRIFLACLTLGVGAIAAIGMVRAAIDQGLSREAAVLLGGDAEIEFTYRFATEDERAWMAGAAQEISEIVDFRSLLVTGEERTLVQVKAIDDAYPLYGALALEGGGDPEAALDGADGLPGLLAAPLLVDRLGLEPGDVVSLGTQDFRLAGEIAREPDGAGASFTYGPRVIVRLADLGGSGLLTEGSLFDSSYRLRLAPDADLEALRQEARDRFADTGLQWRDRRNGTPSIDRFVDRLGAFLILLGLAGLAVGGVGISAAVRSYLEGKTETIATLKTLGAGSRTIFAMFLVQIGLLAAAGIVLGLVVGAALPLLAAPTIEPRLPIPAEFRLYPAPLAEAALYGALTALIFSLWPLARAGDIRAAELFRDLTARQRRLPRPPYIAAIGGLAVLLVGSATWLSGNAELALTTAGGVLAALAVLGVAATALRLAARRLASGGASQGRPALRWALGALGGPSGETASVVMSLGLGLAVLAAIGQIDANLRTLVNDELPDRAPAYFFVDIQNDQLAGFLERSQAQPGVTEVETAPMLRGIITRINGRPAAEVAGSHWALRGDRGVSYDAVPPDDTVVTAGEWWPPDYDGPPLMSFAEEEGRELGLEIGDQITVNILGRDLTAAIASFREVRFETMGINFLMSVNPAALAGAPHTHIATVYADEAAEAPLLRTVAASYPNITAVRVREAIDRLTEAMDGIAAATRWAAAVTLLTGLIVLVGAAAAGERRRVYESAVLKTLGATRARILASFALRSALIGVAAGLVAIAAGAAGGWWVITMIMEADFRFEPVSALAIVAGGAAASLLAGLAFALRPLAARPARVLRARE
jgi:putative ABC transport system permease protein